MKIKAFVRKTITGEFEVIGLDDNKKYSHLISEKACRRAFDGGKLLYFDTEDKTYQNSQNILMARIKFIEDNEFEYVSTAQVLVWKNLSLEAGYATDDKIVAVISYPILKLKDLGVDTPVLDLIEFNVGAYAGIDFNEPGSDQVDADYGVSLTLINIKF